MASKDVHPRRRVLRRSLVTAAALFLVAQLWRPERANPPTDAAQTLAAQVQVPRDVQGILDRSCRDCHTYETRWPWYSRVAPASWLLARDVATGRDELNLSDWGQYDAETAGEQLEAICEQVREREMPLPAYVMLHGEARLTGGDVETLCRWTEVARRALPPPEDDGQ
jgi:Haem-binding domain